MSKVKKQISDSRKINQIKCWNASDISKQSTNFRSKKVHFDTTTRFLDACINFYKDEINDLLISGIDINCADKDNLTAIHQACINSRIDLVEFLLEKKANINVCDKEGWTPLHIAADIGSYELAKFLIDRGARLDVANHDGDLPAMLVDEKDYPDLKIYFQKEMDKRHINTEECSNYERNIMLEDVKKWKANGSYESLIDPINRSTPIHVAASKNYVEILLELLPLLSCKYINTQDIDGWTALHAAAHWGHKEACKLLIIHGADIDIRTRANESVLDTVDPDIKVELTAEIKKAQIEKERLKTHDLKNEICMRPEPANKRSNHASRSSIVRQSVEWKKNAQMKDPVSERQILIKAGLNTESAGIITIEESDEKLVSPQDNRNEIKLEFANLNEDNSSKLTSHLNESKKLKKPFSSEQQNLENINTDTNHRTLLSFPEKVLESKDSQIQFSNGDNSKCSAPSIQITENVESNNEFHSDTDSEELIGYQENAVKMRPKSVRDDIISHRNTATSRLSLVMAPAKSDEAEVSRREKARRVRSIRRSTQAIDLGGVKEVETKKKLETINSNSTELESPSINCPIEPNSSIEHSYLINEKKDGNNQMSLDSESINMEIKEYQVSAYENSSNTKGVNKSDSFCGKLNIDNVDSSSTKKKSPLKHQISCPTSNQNQPITRDHARFNIISKLKTVTSKKHGDIPKPIVTTTQTNFVPITEKIGPGLNVNKCIESNAFPTESIAKFPFKKSDAQPFVNLENIKEKDSGSFVAKPVCGIANKIKNSELDILRNKQLETIPDQDNSGKMDVVFEHTDVSCSKEDNPVSKTILTRMLHDQTTKLELAKENNLLKEEIKVIKEKNKHIDSKLFATGDRKADSEDEKISKLEIEMSKLREENQRLKLQNEALLRVISRIQQELETLR